MIAHAKANRVMWIMKKMEDNKMKKYLGLLIVGCLTIVLCACGSRSKNTEQVNSDEWMDYYADLETNTEEDVSEETDLETTADGESEEGTTELMDDEEETTEENVEESTKEETEEATEEDTEEDTEESEGLGLVSPEFKETMDAYEAFFDEYIEFMTKYAEADATDSLSMLADYTEYMTKYADAMQKMGSINEDELSAADQLYYIEVTTRINTKLVKASLTQ